MARHARLTPRVWAALAAVYVIWGSTYLGIDLAVETLPPFLMLAVRFVAAGAILYAVAGRGLPRPSAREWTAQTAIGAALLAVGTGTVAWGVTKIDIGTAALIVASVPLWLALLDRVLNGVRLSAVVVAGLVVGFLGVGLLVGPGAEGSAIVGVALVFSSAAWAAGTLFARSAPPSGSPFLTAAMQMIGGGLVCALVGVAGGELGDVSTPSATSLVALAYLVVFGSLLAFSAYVWLLSHASVSVVGTYAYVNPIVAVVLGALFLDERLGWVTFAAGSAVVVAVALIVSARPVPRAAPTVAAIPARAK